MSDEASISKSAVRRAGSTIRAWHRGEASEEAFDEAIDTLLVFRMLHSQPLEMAFNELVSLRDGSGMQADMSHRLKRAPTMLKKVIRESKLDLSRMQDIGGCRAVFENLRDLREFERLVLSRWTERKRGYKDYITEPRKSGYRAVHIISSWDGRLIELQLRTESMHEWAQTVEVFSGRGQLDLKFDGDHPVQEYMRILSVVEQYREADQVPPVSTLDGIDTLRPEVLRFLGLIDAIGAEGDGGQP